MLAGGRFLQENRQKLWLPAITRDLGADCQLNSMRSIFPVRISDKSARSQHHIVGVKVRENIEPQTSLLGLNQSSVKEASSSIGHQFRNKNKLSERAYKRGN